MKKYILGLFLFGLVILSAPFSVKAAVVPTSPVVQTSYTLSVNILGTGKGTIGGGTSTSGYINCGNLLAGPQGGTCSLPFPAGSTIGLSAGANATSTFVSWGGDCTGISTSNGVPVVMNANKTCTATFNSTTPPPPTSYTLSVNILGTGNGTISSSSNLNCSGGSNGGGTCSGNFNSGTTVSITATPVSGSVFAGWGGNCNGSGSGSSNSVSSTLNISVTNSCTATATFNLNNIITPTAVYVVTNQAYLQPNFYLSGQITNNGQSNINGIFNNDAKAWFEYGTTSSNLSSSLQQNSSISGQGYFNYLMNSYLNNDNIFLPNTTYYYRACAAGILSVTGAGSVASPFCGNVVSFTTPTATTTTTEALCPNGMTLASSCTTPPITPVTNCAITSFTANPTAVTVAGSTTLSWTTTGCNHVYIDNQYTGFGTSGSEIHPVQGWPGINTFKLSADANVLPGCTFANGYSGYSTNGSLCNSNVQFKTVSVTVNPITTTTCTSTTPAWIKVISPNGGETYTAGQQITVNWTSCNVITPTTPFIYISLSMPSINQNINLAHLANSGSATVILPTTSTWSDMIDGMNYVITVNDNGSMSDASDNLFTINSVVLLCPNGMTLASNCTLPPKISSPDLTEKIITSPVIVAPIIPTTVVAPKATSATVSSTPTANMGTVTLRNGSTGTAVMELQKILNNILNLGLVIDGKLGPKTIAVVKQWQGQNGLVADGLIGPKTKAMLNDSTAKSSSAESSTKVSPIAPTIVSTVVPATVTSTYKLISFTGSKGIFTVGSRGMDSVKIYYLPTGTEINNPSLLGSMKLVSTDTSGLQTWSLSAYQQVGSQSTRIIATNIYAVGFVGVQQKSRIDFSITGTGNIDSNIYPN